MRFIFGSFDCDSEHGSGVRVRAYTNWDWNEFLNDFRTSSLLWTRIMDSGEGVFGGALLDF